MLRKSPPDPERFTQTKESDPLSQADRARMDRVLTAVHPAVRVHGHHHTRFAAPLDGELTGTLDIALAKETQDGSVVLLDTHGGSPVQWTWSVPVSRSIVPDIDGHRDFLNARPTTESLPLRPWAQVELPWPAPALPDSTPRHTVESITANYMALQRQLGHRCPEGPQADSQRPDSNPIRTRRITLMVRQKLSGHPEWADIADEFVGWLIDDDLDALAAHLLDSAPEFDVYRDLSPLPQMWGTPELQLWAAQAARQHHQ